MGNGNDLMAGGHMKIQILAVMSGLALLAGCQSRHTASYGPSDRNYSSRLMNEPAGASTDYHPNWSNANQGNANPGVSYDGNSASSLPGSSAATLPTDVKESQDKSSLNNDVPNKDIPADNLSDPDHSINGGIGTQGPRE
ncbi:MAG: hypothetical protein JWN25_163 [Verrucomicrobiales bacterium]|nr:hypothetical protein [Verrucomicrobiales bacterium]